MGAGHCLNLSVASLAHFLDRHHQNHTTSLVCDHELHPCFGMEFVQDLAGASQSFGESSVKIRKIDTFVILEETRHILNMKPIEGQNSSPAELTHTSATPALGE